MNRDNTPLILAILELIGGYLGLLGLGWMLTGEIIWGLMLLLGYSALLAVGAALTYLSFGCLAFIFGPLYIAAPIISALKLHQFQRGY